MNLIHNEYDAVRLQNYIRDPKRMGIPAKVGSKDGQSKNKKKASSSKKNKYA